MRAFLLSLVTGILITTSICAVDSVHVDRRGRLVIETTDRHSSENGVYNVNFPITVVSAPNNTAYSTATITKDYIYLSGISGQTLNGEIVPFNPITNGSEQINQAYLNVINILNYLELPLQNVVNFEIDIVAADATAFFAARNIANFVTNTFWPLDAPSRTIRGVSFLPSGFFSLTTVIKNTRPIKVRVIKNS